MRYIIKIIFSCLIAVNSYSQDSEVIDFAVENIESINKIVITEYKGAVFTLIKGDEQWSDYKGNCVIQENVGLILDAFKNIEFKSYLPDDVVENYSNRDSITRVKVDIYQNSEYIKSWYIGPPSTDHNGQVMFLKTKSSNGDFPVITKMRGVVGVIEPRFYSDYKKWKCTTIFEISPNEIASISITNFENPKESFSVDISQKDLKVYQDSVRINISDTSSVYRYINKFKKVNFERYDNELTTNQIDSLKATNPFLKLELMDKRGFSKTLYCYRKTDKRSDNLFDENRFWCILFPNDELVICQYFVFNSLIKGEYYFPLTNKKKK